MSRDATLRRVHWRARRGMLELDIILERFLAEDVARLSDAELDTLERLLECPDPDLYTWLMGYASPTDMEFFKLVEHIRHNDSV